MYSNHYETIASRWHGRRLMAVVLLGVLAASLGACSSPVVIEDPDINHPANPNAVAAPMSPAPDTLQVEAVEAPEQDEDPHAHHMMSH